MKKTVTQIRDIQHIEKELHVNPAGVLALNVKEDEIEQIATTFLYQDKNVYFFLDNDDELFENLKYGTAVKFIIVKNEKVKKSTKQDFTPVYNILSISVAGLIKKVDDDKLLASLKENYLKKYSSDSEDQEKPMKSNKVIFIDTEEIQAFEEMGG
jgi:nitroimidazol reductase NimA-like FMN-containing flavoprotein (pyridoxamine 5'-phosphate oxidase superfamily)